MSFRTSRLSISDRWCHQKSMTYSSSSSSFLILVRFSRSIKKKRKKLNERTSKNDNVNERLHWTECQFKYSNLLIWYNRNRFSHKMHVWLVDDHVRRITKVNQQESIRKWCSSVQTCSNEKEKFTTHREKQSERYISNVDRSINPADRDDEWEKVNRLVSTVCRNTQRKRLLERQRERERPKKERKQQSEQGKRKSTMNLIAEQK